MSVALTGSVTGLRSFGRVLCGAFGFRLSNRRSRAAADISRKVRSSHRLRGNAGEPLSQPPYGYLKSPENKKKWVIDPEAAQVVQDMAKAPIEHEFTVERYPDVKAGIVKWPMSVIRVSSENREELAKCCNEILEKWRAYSDESVGIFAETGGVPHNTITPIARKNGDLYECDLVLRNNITIEARPLGVFHPNPSLHHIKKENIDLIEVMGLAVLPARLAKEIDILQTAMLNGENLYAYPELTHHAQWPEDILKRYPDFSKENARAILEQEIGKVFLEVLEDAGVFKRNAEGKNAFLRFTDVLQ